MRGVRSSRDSVIDELFALSEGVDKKLKGSSGRGESSCSLVLFVDCSFYLGFMFRECL